MPWVGNELQCTRGRWNDREGVRYVVSYQLVDQPLRDRDEAPAGGQRHLRRQAPGRGQVDLLRRHRRAAVHRGGVDVREVDARGALRGAVRRRGRARRRRRVHGHAAQPEPAPRDGQGVQLPPARGLHLPRRHHDRRADRRPERQRALARVERRPRRAGGRRGDVLVRSGGQHRRRRPLRRQRVRAEQRQRGLHRVPGRRRADHGRAAVRRDDLHDQGHRRAPTR